MSKWFYSILLIIGLCGLSSCNGSQPPDAKPMVNELPTVAPQVAEATSLPQTQNTVGLTFKITGGPLNFCDDLAINDNGQFTLQQPCKQGVLTGTLIKADLDAFQTWQKDLATFNLTIDAAADKNTPTSALVFNGKGATQPDETLKGAVLDWVNGLIVRMQPPTEPPMPEPMKIGAEGLCSTIKRPAMLVGNYESPYKMFAIDPTTQAKCDIVLNKPLFGPLASAAGNIYYSVFDKEAKSITIWQLNGAGSASPLAFTTIQVAEQFYPFNFAISKDGRKIAWTRAMIDPTSTTQPPPYQNDLWVANLDGSAQVALLQQITNNEERYVVPVRFTADNSTLFYALQPNGLGGPPYGGRYDTLYSRSLAGGESALIFACPKEIPLCIGDISADGQMLVYIDQAKKVQVINRNGNLISSLSAPASDYVGLPTFGATGNLAFVSITFDKQAKTFPPPAKPGYISFIAPPYTEQPQTILTADGVVSIWEWLDENRLGYGMLSEDAFGVGVSVLSLDGQLVKLSTNLPLGVWR